MSRYRVNPDWPHRYREHEPGKEFEATLEPDVEQRALARGAIRLLERSEVKLNPKNVKAPNAEPASADPESANIDT